MPSCCVDFASGGVTAFAGEAGVSVSLLFGAGALVVHFFWLAVDMVLTDIFLSKWCVGYYLVENIFGAPDFFRSTIFQTCDFFV